MIRLAVQASGCAHMKTVLFVVALIALFGLAVIVIPGIMTRRALHEVIARFRMYDALAPERAKTGKELGLNGDDILQGMTGRRDYRPRALEVLLDAEIVRPAGGDRLYLSESKLTESGIEGR